MDYECNCVGCHLGDWVSTQWWRLRLRLGLVKPFVDSDPPTIWSRDAVSDPKYTVTYPVEWSGTLELSQEQYRAEATVNIPRVASLASIAEAVEVNDGMA